MKNLSEEQAWIGAQRMGVNARTLLKTANRSAASGDFGTARALCILSLEESVKAYVLLGDAAGFDQFPHPLSKYFHHHRSKHEAGLVIYFSVRAVLYIIGATRKARRGHGSEAFAERFKEILESDMAALMAREVNYLDRMLAWAEGADKAKQRGLYVDFVNGSWQCPEEIQEPEFQESRRMARDLVFALERTVKQADLATIKEAVAGLPPRVSG